MHYIWTNWMKYDFVGNYHLVRWHYIKKKKNWARQRIELAFFVVIVYATHLPITPGGNDIPKKNLSHPQLSHRPTESKRMTSRWQHPYLVRPAMWRCFALPFPRGLWACLYNVALCSMASTLSRDAFSDLGNQPHASRKGVYLQEWGGCSRTRHACHSAAKYFIFLFYCFVMFTPRRWYSFIFNFF